jgi:hypothetical protein
MVQLPRAATEVPQLLVCAKSPLVTMLLIFNATDALLLTVTVFAALVVPIATLLKEREVLESVAF